MSSKPQILTFESYQKIIKQLSDTDIEYTVVRTGRSYHLTYEGFSQKYMMFDTKKGENAKGYHLCKQVKEHCDIAIKRKGDTFQDIISEYGMKGKAVEQCYNEIGLIKSVNSYVFSVDINDCYWRTMYMLGYIDWWLYIEGLREDSWKLGRNASVGALASKKRIYKY